MSGCSDEELAVVRRFLLDMTEAIERHSHLRAHDRCALVVVMGGWTPQ